MAIDELLKWVQRLRGGEADRMPWKELQGLLAKMMTGFIWPGHKGIDSNTPIYRGRALTGPAFVNVSDLSYRKAADCRDYGRCHSPGVPVFYGSLNLEVMLAELAAEHGGVYQVAHAQARPGNELFMTQLGQITHYRRWGRTLFADQKMVEFFADLLRGREQPTDEQLHWILFDAYLTECFSRRAWSSRDYKVTSAVCDLLFKSGYEALVYPSVAFGGGLNIAIAPGAFDRDLLIRECALLKVTHQVGLSIYGYSVERESTSISDGKISGL